MDGKQTPHTGDGAQMRVMLEAMAEQTIAVWNAQHPQAVHQDVEIPTPLKWAGGLVSAILVMIFVGGVGWMGTTLNQMQITVSRMDERQLAQGEGSFADTKADIDALTKRTELLEDYHRQRRQ